VGGSGDDQLFGGSGDDTVFLAGSAMTYIASSDGTPTHFPVATGPIHRQFLTAAALFGGAGVDQLFRRRGWR
jgi:Ca2+-binding RTX toxin-like protein